MRVGEGRGIIYVTEVCYIGNTMGYLQLGQSCSWPKKCSSHSASILRSRKALRTGTAVDICLDLRFENKQSATSFLDWVSFLLHAESNNYHDPMHYRTGTTQ